MSLPATVSLLRDVASLVEGPQRRMGLVLATEAGFATEAAAWKPRLAL